VNYYERYCGDYGRDTAHLSLAEHGAYTLMLDAYYSMERAFSADYAPLYRICRAMTKLEQAAVKSVADEFFPVGDDGLRHNSRADRDITKALKRINARRANGSKGGRPKNDLLGSENETKEKPARLRNDNLLGTLRETYPGEALHQTPCTTRQQKKNLTPLRRAEPDGFRAFWNAWPASRRKVARAKCRDVWEHRHLEELSNEINRHVSEMRSSEQWHDGYEPAPLTYLNQRRWEDGAPTSAPPQHSKRVAL